MRLWILLIMLALPASIQAQYRNEWINYEQSYWKFRTGTEGIYRISKAELDAAGIPAATPGSRFMLFRDGREVSIRTTTDAAFGSSDYIEFYGTMADGNPDREVYLDPAKLADDKRNLFSDTAAYFLTISPVDGHLRYQPSGSPIPGSPPPPVPWCRVIQDFHGRSFYFKGKSTQRNEFFYSSQFDQGEGFTDGELNAWDTKTKTFSTPNVVTSAAEDAVLRLSSLALNYYDSLHKLRVSFNGNQVADVVYGAGDMIRLELPIPASSLSTTNTMTTGHYNTAPSPDTYGLGFWELQYPRNFDVSGLDFFRFILPASSSNQYLEFLNFNHGGTAPRLYDISNNKVYEGDISISGKTRFYIDPALSDANFLLCAAGSNQIYSLPLARRVQFTNYADAGNQGNYLIITHRNFLSGSGTNYVDAYKSYRSSSTGGNYKVIVADVEELYDQFAYGIDAHPLSIRHFLDQAYERWTTKPEYVFLIGKSLELRSYRDYLANPTTLRYTGLVPTFGHPGSDVDFVNDRSNWKMKMSISRLSAWTNEEIGDYLNKVKLYESAIRPASFPTPATELWKKQWLHIAGGNGTTSYDIQSAILLPTLNRCADIAQNIPAGGEVLTVAKSTKGLPTTIEDKAVDSLISDGLSMITYYGHGSAYALDYNLRAPGMYSSMPRIPFFSGFGCAISDIFQQAAGGRKTISEDWIAATNSGAVASLAPSNLGYTNFHSAYMPVMYHFITAGAFGQSIGHIYRACNDSMRYLAGSGQTNANLTHLECYILQGDPAVTLPQTQAQPDYYVGNETVSSIPVNVTTALDSFRLRIVSFNLGRSLDDTVSIRIEHTNPSGARAATRTFTLYRMRSRDTAYVYFPIDKIKDLGLNRYKVMIDPDNRYAEGSESNNTANIDLFIASDDLVPVYPKDFSIVHQTGVTLKASTLNVFRGMRRYLMEIDTTELFNSPSKLSTSIASAGGVVKWTPALSMRDSAVYYWRCAADTLVNGAYNWSGHSFIYLRDGTDGWNQSHYYQYLSNNPDSISYGTDRMFRYGNSSVVLRVINSVMELPAPYSFYGAESANSKVFRNGADLQLFDCQYNGSIQFMVFDSSSGKAWENPPGGRQGAQAPCRVNRNQFAFSFLTNTAESRNNARKFLDSIPEGYFILVKNVIYHPFWGNQYVNVWQDDTTLYGSGKSLYHSMRLAGFDQIDSFYFERPFALMCRKGRSSYPVQQYFGRTIDQFMDTTFSFPVTDTKGSMNSVVIGPSASWKTLRWRTSAKLDTAASADSVTVRITGLDRDNNPQLLYEGTTRDTSLDFISASSYPRLRLQWRSTDTVYHTAPQLDYWRVLFTPLPEAALNPAALYTFTDSVSVGQLMQFSTAIETLSELPMDSMLVRYKIIDANNVSHLLADKKYRKLAGNDTLHASVSFDPKPYPGKNFLFIEANPDNNQPEEYHPNNLGYLPFSIQTDERNPVLDVTFDGTHILDQDIVSARPFIKVLLKDENKFLPLNDTGALHLSLRYPSDPPNTRRVVPVDGSICRFVPADMSAGKNEAYIEFKPTFMEDGTYQLYASGKDITGNGAGAGNEYTISFKVFNKAMISNLLNYPNPFSTATSFVFTLTGWQVPSQLKIQVLTVTGKVVREITKQELGPIRIGRNITEYKWDGKDQYGQTLGNGVYLYRVISSLEGKDLERYGNSTVDKFFKNGYGKMYIMR